MDRTSFLDAHLAVADHALLAKIGKFLLTALAAVSRLASEMVYISIGR